jgi:GntR family transcriptional regulator, transcriptional repressor for pyruvate dehydrogenase complex
MKLADLSDRIRAHILEKGYTPGTRIETEKELAELFNVSRYKIRTILGALVQQGVLTKSPRRGTYVNEFDPVTASKDLWFQYQLGSYNLNEFIEARIVVEQAIVPLVVRRITPAQISGLQEAIDRMIEQKHTPKHADTADQDFHIRLIEASGNELLSSFSSVITLLFHQESYRSKYWNPDTVERLAREHQLILNAVVDGDEELALERHREHLSFRQRITRNQS